MILGKTRIIKSDDTSVMIEREVDGDFTIMTLKMSEKEYHARMMSAMVGNPFSVAFSNLTEGEREFLLSGKTLQMFEQEQWLADYGHDVPMFV